MELNLHDVCSNPKAVKLRSHEYPGNTSGCAGFVSQHWLRVCLDAKLTELLLHHVLR